MTSDELKYAVMQYWRFQRQVEYIATEVDAYSINIKDILLVSKNKIIEIECKVSAQDFMADFEKRKHYLYTDVPTHYGNPNYLYYAVPHDLKIDESVFDRFPNYGLIRVSRTKEMHYYHSYVLEFQRKAKDLHAGTSKEDQDVRVAKAKRSIFRRMSSDIVNMRRKLINQKERA